MGANAKDLGTLARNLDMRNRIEKSVKVPTLPLTMSKADAILYARHLFGPMGAVTKGQPPIPRDFRCMVGLLEDTEEKTSFRIAGAGGTWEEAFAQAETTLAREKARGDNGTSAESGGGGDGAGLSTSEGGAPAEAGGSEAAQAAGGSAGEGGVVPPSDG